MMTDKKVLIACDMNQRFLNELTRMGFLPEYQPEIEQTELEKIIHDYAGLVLSTSIHVNESLLSKASRLKWIGRAGSGMENIDVSLANTKQIYCFNSPEGNRNAVAEQALGMLLALFQNISKADKELKQGIWHREENRGIELDGLCVGIIGFGNTGSSFAKKLRGFDVRVLAFDKYKTGFGNTFVQESHLQQIFDESDVVSMHIPLTGETQYLVNEHFFYSFSKPIYFINTSRGKVLNTSELVYALDSGKVKGACLDVFETEPLEAAHLNKLDWYNKLSTRENVILTPHIAGWTQESKEKIGKVLLEKLEKHLF